MGFSSLQVCMDTSDWLQGTIHEECGMDSSSPSGEMLACSRPLIERRLRPPHDQALKCPRCDSTHTKFCYYNNYSLSQPRYFCKTCRRYWTKGGTLRNIPVGGGCRKNKKVSARKSNDQTVNSNPSHTGQSSSHHNHTDLQLSFPAEVQLSHLSHFLGANAVLGEPNFMESKYSAAVLENPMPLDFKFEGITGNPTSYDFTGNSREFLGMVNGVGDVNGHNGLAQSFNNPLCSPPFGMAIDGNNSGTYVMDSVSRLMLPYDDHSAAVDVKPNPKLLSLDWQDQGCSDTGKHSFGYANGVGSWTGMMSGYGSSSTNSFV